MPRLTTTTLVLLALATRVLAATAAIRNAGEAATDHRPWAPDHAGSERDRRELSEFERLVTNLRDAYQDRMTGRYRDANARLQAAMDREIEQARVKRAQAANEERRARRVGWGRPMEAGTGGHEIDYLQVIDDGRELRACRSEPKDRGKEMARIGVLSASLQNAIRRGDRAAMARNIDLGAEFLVLLRADGAAKPVCCEPGEDPRERRADRR
jgi:hypothetical protein